MWLHPLGQYLPSVRCYARCGQSSSEPQSLCVLDRPIDSLSLSTLWLQVWYMLKAGKVPWGSWQNGPQISEFRSILLTVCFRSPLPNKPCVCKGPEDRKNWRFWGTEPSVLGLWAEAKKDKQRLDQAVPCAWWEGALILSQRGQEVIQKR
jgi:hypothetical protein